MPARVLIGDAWLTASRLTAVARGAGAVLTDAARERIAASHETLNAAARAGTPIYGVTTGLGAVADTRIVDDDAGRQHRVVLARSVGVGRTAMEQEVRAMIAARLAGFAAGCSGVSPGVADALSALLDSDVSPVVPMTGSVGEGDLAPLAHVGAVLAGAGEARCGGATLTGAEALARAGIAPPAFAAKDGLALVSSNAAATGIAAIAVTEAVDALGGAIAAAALSFEGFRANIAPLLPEAVAPRPAPGQAAASIALLRLLDGGDLVRPDAARRLQDPLSFRCVASVYGAAIATLKAATAAVELELNTADDNPAIVPGRGVVPNANFDPTHLVLALGALNQGLARVAATIGMRTSKLLSEKDSALPRFLTPMTDGRSGFAPVQKTVAALTVEIQHAAMPLPVWVMPVADGVEDVSTMALPTAGKTREIVERLRMLAGIELMIAAQACDLRAGTTLGCGSAGIQAAVRERVAGLDEDRATAPDIVRLGELVAEGRFTALAADALAAI